MKKENFDENNYRIINGDSLKVLDTLEENSIDACITDPPYELGFMGKGWDKSGIAYNVEFWKKVYRTMKSGAYLLAFGGTRTFHRIACAIEDAGFEIRDTIMWLYGSGFPKSMNIGLAIDKKNGIESEVVGTGRCGKTRLMGGLREETHDTSFEVKKANNEWDGYGTALKPAYEPIIVARKPVEKSVVDNVLKYRVGGINIDECRVGDTGGVEKVDIEPNSGSKNSGFILPLQPKPLNMGRFPANVILTYDETDEQEVCGGMPNTKGNTTDSPLLDIRGNNYNNANKTLDISYERGFNDEGSAARYFYCAKASKKDRDSGLDMLDAKSGHIKGNGLDRVCEFCGASQLTPWLCKCEVKSWVAKPRKNIHPTVKPVELMQYLVRLVSPKGATILDPFNGSGSTGKAVAFENREREREYKYIGIELDKEYCEISKGRIDYALNKYEYDMIEDIKKEEKETGQLSLFDFDEGE